jgi:DNA-binding beta-propeller fold protein YncE
VRGGWILGACAGLWVLGAGAGCSAPPGHPAGQRLAAARQAARRSPPGCGQAVAKAPSLPGVATAGLTVPGAPFGMAATRDGRWAFTSLPSSLAVLSTAGFDPKLVRTIGLPGQPEGLAITPNGQDVLVANQSGATVVSVARAEQGRAHPVLGTLSSSGTGATDVAFSPGGEFAFVTLESSDEAAVYNLAEALAHGFGRADFVGDIPLSETPVGMAVSPDGKWLYATSEESASGQGTLTVINLTRAETDPAGSAVASAQAGCGAVRVITSADGDDVWVTARESDALLLFDAAKLRSDPAHALVTWVRVGEAPVDLVLIDHGTRLIVGNSNRFGALVDTAGPSTLPGGKPIHRTPLGQADLGVVSVADVLAGRPAVLGVIGSGEFPRDFALEANGKTLLVGDYYANEVEAVNVTDVP